MVVCLLLPLLCWVCGPARAEVAVIGPHPDGVFNMRLWGEASAVAVCPFDAYWAALETMFPCRVRLLHCAVCIMFVLCRTTLLLGRQCGLLSHKEPSVKLGILMPWYGLLALLVEVSW